MDVESLIMAKLAALVKAKAMDVSMTSLREEVKAAKNALEEVQQKMAIVQEELEGKHRELDECHTHHDIFSDKRRNADEEICLLEAALA